MLLETLSQNWRRARATNTTDNGFPSRVPTLTKPSGSGGAAAQTTASVFQMGDGGVLTQNSIIIKPYGAGANNATMSVRVIGWRQLSEGVEATIVWDPTILVELACTLSSSVTGPAGGLVTTTDLFADTLTISNSSANAGVNVNVVSPANDTAAHAVIDFEGYQLLEVTFTTGGSATNCNALLALI